MCGLVGLFDTREDRPVDPALIKAMNDALAHRGPDGDGQFVGPGIGLGHRRLAIIDVATGQQPMFDESGQTCLVFNGEIYNYQDLTRELEALGYRFRTNSDTEVILHAWHAWGADSVKRLRGMFAYAIWDGSARTLFLARDRMGKKPLYVADLGDGWIGFASELKALACHPGFDTAIDPCAVEDYFAYGYVPDPKTIYTRAEKLEPAHSLLWRRGAGSKYEEYWTLRMSEDGPAKEDSAREALVARLEEAVRVRLMSEVPLGAFLSGGVDSSGIVALMAGLMDQPVNTLSIKVPHAGFDESGYAQQIADRYATDHHVRVSDPASAIDLVDRLAGVYDEPFGDPSALPTYQVCALAREHMTVALSGDGGDELFAGYRRYRWHSNEERVRRMLPDGARKTVFGALAKVYPQMDWAPRAVRLKNTFRELSLDSAMGFFVNVSVLNDGIRSAIFSDRLKRELQGYHAADVLRHHMARADTEQPLLQAQYADFKTYLAGGILTKVDRASMANSLEVRAPLLDHELVEWSARLPANLKLHGGNGKYILKRAFEPLVPNDLLTRPKQGFSLPLADWFRGPLKAQIRDAVTGPAMAATDFFDIDQLTRLVDQHQSGQRDHGPVLWVLMAFDSFLRQNAGLCSPARAA